MGSIFISYRREDSQGEALHLCDDLKAQFGGDRVFMDVTGIAPGKDFRKVIENAVTTCDALIVMIGKKWIGAVDEQGNRRLDSPKDYVRIETAAALRRDIPVIPVLVQGAAMPPPEQLPDDLEALTWRNAFELRHSRWSIDVAELISGLREILPTLSADSSGPAPSRPWWRTTSGSRAMGGLVAALIGVVVLQQAGAFDGARTVADETDRAAGTETPGLQQTADQQAPGRQDPVPSGVQQETLKQRPDAVTSGVQQEILKQRPDAVTSGVQPEVTVRAPLRPAPVPRNAEQPPPRISMVGNWAGSSDCVLEIYADDGETIAGRCDVEGYTHKVTGRYTDSNHISTTITRTDPANCVTSVAGYMLLIDRNHATFGQNGWNGCGVTTGPVSQRLSRQ